MPHHDLAGFSLSLLLGAVLGARHAFEPDHLAAVSVLSAQRPGAAPGALLGMWWGLGHALSLLGVGLVLALLSARMPERLSSALELGVAGMLVGLGGRALTAAMRPRHPTVLHGQHSHAAEPMAAAASRSSIRPARPLLVGMVHGLAGSGALTALAFAALPTHASRIAYMSVFGLGSALGMAVISGLWGWPLARLSRRPRAARWVSGAAGLGSAAIGLWWAIGAIDKLFA